MGSLNTVDDFLGPMTTSAEVNFLTPGANAMPTSDEEMELTEQPVQAGVDRSNSLRKLRVVFGSIIALMAILGAAGLAARTVPAQNFDMSNSLEVETLSE